MFIAASAALVVADRVAAASDRAVAVVVDLAVAIVLDCSAWLWAASVPRRSFPQNLVHVRPTSFFRCLFSYSTR